MVNSAEYHWKEKNILVVEDDESSAYLLGEILKGTGANIVYSTDGEGAIEYIRQHPKTDLILMDIQLPGIDGYEATRRLRANPKFARTPIVAVTSFALSGDDMTGALKDWMRREHGITVRVHESAGEQPQAPAVSPLP